MQSAVLVTTDGCLEASQVCQTFLPGLSSPPPPLPTPHPTSWGDLLQFRTPACSLPAMTGTSRAMASPLLSRQGAKGRAPMGLASKVRWRRHLPVLLVFLPPGGILMGHRVAADG